MTPAEINLLEDSWDLLQQPDGPPGGMDPRYRLLLAALDVGWQVEEPVVFRPRWGEGSSWVYHFVLRRSPHTPPRLLSVRASPEIERFVRDEGLRLSRGG